VKYVLTALALLFVVGCTESSIDRVASIHPGAGLVLGAAKDKIDAAAVEMFVTTPMDRYCRVAPDGVIDATHPTPEMLNVRAAACNAHGYKKFYYIPSPALGLIPMGVPQFAPKPEPPQ
jgi:hypothetical protein